MNCFPVHPCPWVHRCCTADICILKHDFMLRYQSSVTWSWNYIPMTFSASSFQCMNRVPQESGSLFTGICNSKMDSLRINDVCINHRQLVGHMTMMYVYAVPVLGTLQVIHLKPSETLLLQHLLLNMVYIVLYSAFSGFFWFFSGR